MATGAVSWEVSPRNTRWLRVIGYAVTGLFSGLLLATAALFGPDLLSGLIEGAGWAHREVVFLALIALFLGPILWAGMRNARISRRRFRIACECHEVYFSPWSVIASLLVLGFVVGTERLFGPVFSTDFYAFSFAVLLVSMALTVVVASLTSVGEVDPESMTFTENKQDEYDLRHLRAVKRTTVGPYSFVLLLFARDYDDRKSAQDLYVLPTEETDRAMPAFESGIEADVGIPKEPGRFRRVNSFVTLVAVALATVPFPLFLWLGMPLYMYLQYLYVSCGIVLLFSKFLIKTL